MLKFVYFFLIRKCQLHKSYSSIILHQHFQLSSDTLIYYNLIFSCVFTHLFNILIPGLATFIYSECSYLIVSYTCINSENIFFKLINFFFLSDAFVMRRCCGQDKQIHRENGRKLYTSLGLPNPHAVADNLFLILIADNIVSLIS